MEFDTVAPGTYPGLVFPPYESTGLSAGAGLILPNDAGLSAIEQARPFACKPTDYFNG